MTTKHKLPLLLFFAALFTCHSSHAQNNLDSIVPVRGFAIAAPPVSFVDSFVQFIEKELAPRQVNTLVLRVDFNYQFTSHPELRDSIALSKSDVKKIVAACRKSNMRLIPQINLLGHQSWASTTQNLLEKYPEFDETPEVKMPETYKWPNADSLYCKSYCPLHPKVHDVVFALMDEICDAFEATAFHAGMDEVFYIGSPKCPRCKGKDKAKLFADEVTRISDHLAKSKRELWIWGDRLIDGSVTGLGIWEASQNNTHAAVDMIPRSVVICDWHYNRADKTPVYFAMKGLNVITCPWRNPSVAITQLHDMVEFRNESTKTMKPRFQGVMQTVWSGAPGFVRDFYANRKDPQGGNNTPQESFRQLFTEIEKLKDAPVNTAGSR